MMPASIDARTTIGAQGARLAARVPVPRRVAGSAARSRNRLGMPVTLEQIERERARRWRTAPERRVCDERGALRFIRELGFVTILPVSGSELPTLHTACGSAWGAWWDWKQTLPERRACYYTHLLRRRGTFISWEWFPAFCAAYAEGKPYWRLYREGLLDSAEKRVLDVLADNGPLMTRELRLAYGPASKENTRRVKQVLVELQRRFLICAAGGSTEGWSHHRWDLVDRWVGPARMQEAAAMTPAEARRQIAEQFLRNALATTAADMAWFLGWERGEAQGMIAWAIAAGTAERMEVTEMGGEVIVPRPWPGGAAR